MKARLRIGFNMWPFSTTQAGGMAYYALSMLREFCRMVPEDMVLFYGAHGKDLVATVKEIRNIRQVELKNPAELYDYRSVFDTLFTPTIWGGVNMSDCPTVHVIPDIQEKYYPEFFSAEELDLRDTIAGHAARASTILITISHFSKKTIVDKFRIPDEQVHITRLAAHPIFSDDTCPGTRPTGMPERLDRFLLYPSNSWGHKNHKKLLDGLLQLRNTYGMEIPCVFTGHLLKGQFHHVDIPREIGLRGLEKQAYHLGTVSLAELKYLYLHAAALIHPSLFEGFGIPLVEAMSCGCPIIAADVTSIPEVAGDAALYFDPNDAADIADKIHRFVELPADVEHRVSIGRALARNFNETRTAEETLGILERAYSIAGIESLKARAADRLSRGTFLSMLLVFQESPEAEPIGEIQELLREFPDSIQMMALAPEALREALIETFRGKIPIRPLQGCLREAVSKASEDLAGEYVFLSDGKSVIVPSFMYYLLADEVMFRGSGELLEGDWYRMATGRKGFADAPILSTKEEEKRKAPVCENLSFVVRKQAFRRVLQDGSPGPDTVSGIASDVWEACSKTRIYRTAVVRFARETCGETHNLSIVTRKLKESLAIKPWLRPLLATRVGSRLLATVVQTYYRAPVRLQRVLLGMYKTVGGR